MPIDAKIGLFEMVEMLLFTLTAWRKENSEVKSLHEDDIWSLDSSLISSNCSRLSWRVLSFSSSY